MPGIQSILIPVPEAEPFVGPFRRAGDWSSGHGIPAHLTIAGPWPLATCLPLRPLRKLRAAIDGERYTLGTIGTLGDAVCLFPDDDRALLSWRESVLAAVGSSDDTDAGWRIHLTVSRGLAPPAMREIEASIATALPLHCEIDGLLIAKHEADSRITVQPL
jgi:2'-5' RNA ligase superfamily